MMIFIKGYFSRLFLSGLQWVNKKHCKLFVHTCKFSSKNGPLRILLAAEVRKILSTWKENHRYFLNWISWLPPLATWADLLSVIQNNSVNMVEKRIINVTMVQGSACFPIQLKELQWVNKCLRVRDW